ncbi:MAG: HD-GYP domain-containing protein [Planctomycetota bacterium]|nr:HD-GYP domain-containing protein [Planctomycetaceae bacterium]MDQ3330034.1 HD-GYP domain-containing protein [Planctomycetota bacterium]
MLAATIVAPVGVTKADQSSPPFAAVARLVQQTSLPFLCVEASRGVCFDRQGSELPPFLPERILSQLLGLSEPATIDDVDGLIAYAVPLPSHGGRFIAYGYQLAAGAPLPAELRHAAKEAGWSDARLQAWATDQPRCTAEPLAALLRFAASDIAGDAAVAESQILELSEQLDRTYEEISLLHSLSHNLQISTSPAELVALCLDRLPGLIDAESHLVQLRPPGESSRIWSNGDLPFSIADANQLLIRLDAQESSRPIVRNFIAGSPLAAKYPRLRNFVAVPVREGRHRFGWIISTNLSGGREFGTIEASFLNTIATILGTHVRNIDLLHEQNDLLVGFVRSFVSTLDAKDPYTRGHSERVALIARRIGEQMRLPDEYIEAIYLSGLLHDVGKIGVDDQILRKNGPLTDEEFAQVKKHPVIGYNILSSLKNLRHVLPGVRNHHESFDGTGYPDGLAGDDIPLLARVLAVADAYDAMSSDRPYRKGMPSEKIDEVFRRGRNRQWDGEVLDGYFDCRDDILMICAAYSFENRRAFGDGI